MSNRLGVIGLAVAAFGGLCIYMGIKEFKLCEKALPEPQTISYQQLVERGYGQNAHVRLTNAVPVTEWLICRGKDDKTGEGPWDAVYFPAVADDNPWVNEAAEALQAGRQLTTTPQDIRVLLGFMRVKNAKVLHAKLAKHMDRPDPAIQGTIINEVYGVHSDTKKLLQQSYPGINTETMLILHVDRKPSTTQAMGLFVGGGAGILAGLVMVVIYRLRVRRLAQAARSVEQPDPASPPPAHNAGPQSQRDRDAEQLAQFSRDEEQLNR